ncbi:NUDIX domain-containing protein [Methylobacterium sp. Leaf456]|uniref:NUDIX domain-containing protein n=1 Tax=Methylobacterium sp. Leaf456 TaxID=1736382 RepID=UPI0012E34AB1|nr:NUDIX domain-containing protein [Methylobacterium sp. Leaf456]
MRVDDDMLVDTVDNSNHAVGRMIRRALLPNGANFRTVHVLLRSPPGQLVLQKLRDDHPRSPGKIGSSVAGYLRAGETYESAAKRKLYDEMRSRAKLAFIGELSMIDKGSEKFVHVYGGRSVKMPDFDHEQIARLIYLSQAEIESRLENHPEQFTETFQHVFRTVGSKAFR